jgi:hypothetical protein
MDQRLGAGGPPVVVILRDVFAADLVATGPQWILDPPSSMVERFWSQFGATIGPDQVVYVAKGRVRPERIRDVHERPVLAVEARRGEPAAFFFIDRAPRANWAHACTYVVMFEDGEAVTADHRWPPSSAIARAALPRPLA